MIVTGTFLLRILGYLPQFLMIKVATTIAMCAPLECYAIKGLSSEKLAHLNEMYNRYISVDRRPSWLPPPQPVRRLQAIPITAAVPSTSEPAKAHQKIVHSRKKKK